MDNFFYTEKTVTDAEIFKKTVEFKVCLTANVSVWTARKKECADSEYKKAQDADIAEIRKGNYNLREYEGSIYTK